VAEFDSVVPPGGQGKVTASIDSAKFKGPISKSVTLYSNDPANERVLLRLSAEILVPIDVRPRDRIYVRGKADSLGPQELLLVAMDGEPFTIREVQKQSDALSLKVTPAPESALERADGKKAPKAKKAPKDALAGGHAAYQLVVTFAADAPPGNFSDRLRVMTDHPKMPTIDITVSGRLEGDVSIRPERLFFLSRGGTSTTQQELNLAKRPAGGLAITKVTSTNPSFTANLRTVEEGFEYVVEVNRATDAVGQTGQAQLIIETNDPRQSRIEVPIVAR
jgi:hypothetical protein